MDKASSHISKESINFLVENNITYNLIPSGLTPILQPLDISINKVFKDSIKNFKSQLNRRAFRQTKRMKRPELHTLLVCIWENYRFSR